MKRWLRILSALLVAVVAGLCGCPSSSPKLSVSPLQISVQQGVNSAAFTIANTGSGTLTWNASCGADWVGLTPSSGSGNGTVLVSIDRAAMSKTTYSTLVQVTSNGGNATVSLDVSDEAMANPAIQLSTTTIDFASVATTGSFSIYNIGGGTLTWSTSGFAAWVSLSAVSGTAPSAVDVTINRALLAPGYNVTIVPISSNGGNANLTITATGAAALTPSIAGLAPWSTATLLPTASVGDTVTISGSNFSSTASNNTVSFSGVEVIATSYETGSVGQEHLTAIVPGGATTGLVKVRVAGNSTWSNGITMHIVPPTQFTLSSGWESNGIFHPTIVVSAADTFPQSWVLSGTNFEAVDDYAPGNGLGLEVNGEIQGNITVGTIQTSCRVQVVSDTQVMVPWISDEVIASARASGSLQVRLVGRERTTRSPRYSNLLTLDVSDDPYINAAYHAFDVHWLNTYPYSLESGQPLEVPRGDWLFLAQANVADDTIRCPALWSGDILFGDIGIMARRFLMGNQGTFTIENVTRGTSRTVIVKDEGVPYSAGNPQPTACFGGVGGILESNEDSLLLGCGGTRLSIPAGAIPLDQGRVAVVLEYDLYSDSGIFDPEASDGRRVCSVRFVHADAINDGWEVTQLNHPITIEIPFTYAGVHSGLSVGCFDPESSLYYSMPTTIDSANRKAILVLPAGEYSASKGAKAANGIPPVTLNTITRRLGVPYLKSSNATVSDPDDYFAVEYITDPESDSYVTDAYADEILNVMVDAYNNLGDQGWRQPTNTTKVYLRSWALISGYGETSKGVFGEPYIGINIAKCPQGASAFYTTAAHEVGHVFQRQYTTNITTKWFDEASAEWAALDSVSFSHFATEALNDAVPFVKTLPNGFYFGFNSTESYAASPWPIWLEREYAQSVLGVYELLDSSPSNWGDSYGVFQEVTGETMASLYREFAECFWMQQESPLTSVLLDSNVQAALGHNPLLVMTGYPSVTTPNVGQPAMSSVRYTVSIESAFAAQCLGRDIVLRTSGLTGLFREIRAFRDSGSPDAPPVAPVKLATLNADTTSVLLGPVASGTHYRLILTNPDGQNSANIRATLVIPNITSLSPNSGPATGGYSVTVAGSGFGSVQGQILFSASPVPITSWSDSSITFVMPNAGPSSSWSLNVRTAENATTNALVFAFSH